MLPLTAIAGPGAALGVGIFLAVAATVQLILVWRRVGFALVVTCATLAPAVAAAAVVAARGQGLSEALTLLTAVCLYDMASFLTGTGPRGGVVGALVGMVTVGVLAVFVAAVVEPPFSGRSPWVLLGLVAVLAPVGVFLAGRICPERRLPALRRLDSLILAGPAWVIARRTPAASLRAAIPSRGGAARSRSCSPATGRTWRSGGPGARAGAPGRPPTRREWRVAS